MIPNKYSLYAFIIFLSISCQEMTGSEPTMTETNLASESVDYANAVMYEANGKQSDESELASTPDASNQGISTNNQAPAIKNRKMIWRADIEFQVKDMEKSSSAITSLCNSQGAFISGMQMNTSSHQMTNTMEIRVSSIQFNALIDKLKAESIYTDRIEISSNDVTEEFIDIESRLKTKKDVRDRYISILRQKTGSIKDVIEAEEAIRKITEEIEAKEGRLRYLRDQVSLSTITLTIYQKVEFKRAPDVYEKSYGDDVVDSFGMGWRIITTLFLALVAIWPIILIGIVVLIIWKRKHQKPQ